MSVSAGSSEVWVPPWATVELHQLQLDEVDALLAEGTLTAEEEGLATLRAATLRGELLVGGPGLRCEARMGGAASHVMATLTLPPFYPQMPPVVSLSASGSRDRADPPELLAALERALREEALRPAEGGQALQAGVEWLQSVGPRRLEQLRARRSSAEAAAARAPASEEREDQAVRKAEKFSPNWDLCTAFVKTGKCKNKDCKWRHERPEAPAPKIPEPCASKPEAPASKKPVSGAKKKR